MFKADVLVYFGMRMRLVLHFLKYFFFLKCVHHSSLLADWRQASKLWFYR